MLFRRFQWRGLASLRRSGQTAIAIAVAIFTTVVSIVVSSRLMDRVRAIAPGGDSFLPVLKTVLT
jgi:hypothetical protein